MSAPSAVRTRAAAARATARPARDAGRTQAAILDAATHEFAQHGLGGARVDRIAARAKHQQADAVLLLRRQGGAVPRRAGARVRAHPRRGADAAPRPTCRRPTASRRLVAFTWSYFLAHPEFMTLLNSENLHRARHLKRSRKIRAMHSPLVATLSEVLDARRARGRVPTRRRPGAALRVDRGARLLLPVEQPHAVDDLRARPDGAPGQGRPASRTSRRWCWVTLRQ